MRISDWSSDVCSSDLLVERGLVYQYRHRAQGCCRDGTYIGNLLFVLQFAEMQGRSRRPAENRTHAVHQLDRLQIGRGARHHRRQHQPRSEEHTSELQSLMRISYAVFCLKKKKTKTNKTT